MIILNDLILHRTRQHVQLGGAHLLQGSFPLIIAPGTQVAAVQIIGGTYMYLPTSPQYELSSSSSTHKPVPLQRSPFQPSLPHKHLHLK